MAKSSDIIRSTLKGSKHPTLLVVGKTGTGKSTLCNVIAGNKHDAEVFPASGGAVSCTQDTKFATFKFNNNREKISLIDTLGFDDPNNDTDAKIITNLVKAVKEECDYVNLFAIAVNGQSPRLDESLVAMITIFVDMFGQQFWKQCVIVFTRMDMSEVQVEKRQRCHRSGGNDDEVARVYLREVEKRFPDGFPDGEGLKHLFLDACYNWKDSGEVEKFNEAMNELYETLVNSPKLPTSQVKENVQTENAKLKKELKKLGFVSDLVDGVLAVLSAAGGHPDA